MCKASSGDARLGSYYPEIGQERARILRGAINRRSLET